MWNRVWDFDSSERPKRQKLVSAETEISAKLTEASAEISAETLPKITWKQGFNFKFLLLHSLYLVFGKKI